MKYFSFTLILLAFTFSTIPSMADDYDYDPYYENDNSFEVFANVGYSIITHEKSIFWDNGYNVGFGGNVYLQNNLLLGISAGYTAYYPNVGINQIDREYRYEIYPLIFHAEYKLGSINDLGIYGGLGLAYIYGEYKIDDIQYLNSGQKLRIRYLYATNGFGIIPNLKVRSPFGDNLAVEASIDYSLIFMQSRNNAELSLDHINIKLAAVYIF